MRKEITGGIISILLIIFIIWMCLGEFGYCGEVKASVGTTGVLGHISDTQITKLDINYSNNKTLSKKWSYDKEMYFPLYITENDAYGGIGIRARLKYHFTKDLYIFSGVGTAYVHKAKNIGGLESNIIQNAELGLGYKYFIVKYDHDSTLWVRGDGANFAFAGLNFNF